MNGEETHEEKITLPTHPVHNSRSTFCSPNGMGILNSVFKLKE